MKDSDDINQHKRMAMGGDQDSGDFGVEKMAEHAKGQHPDMGRMTHKKHLHDGARGAPRPIERGEAMHAAQAAPDHGPA